VGAATAPAGSDWLGLGVTGAIIVLGLLTRSVVAGLIGTTLAGVAFYAVVLSIVRGPLRRLRPRWSGPDRRATTVGLAGGLSAGAGLSLILLAGGGLSAVAPGVRMFLSEGSIARTLAVLVLTAGVAPVVEELAFRGVVAESLGHRGGRVAVGVSAALFAVAHLGSLPYYAVTGAALGALYRRGGLSAAIAAHVAFNASAFTVILVGARLG
jgi:hypothetical protein